MGVNQNAQASFKCARNSVTSSGCSPRVGEGRGTLRPDSWGNSRVSESLLEAGTASLSGPKVMVIDRQISREQEKLPVPRMCMNNWQDHHLNLGELSPHVCVVKPHSCMCPSQLLTAA